MFQYNVQHDCRAAQCVASGLRAVHQERVVTDLIESFVEHKALDQYLINTHAFHNAHLVRNALPRDLVAPLPYVVDRRAHHSEISASLRNIQADKRQKTAQEKQADADAAKKATEDDRPGGNIGHVGTQTRRKRRREEGDPVGESSGQANG